MCGLSATDATILTFGSMPYKEDPQKHNVWPWREGRARDGEHTSAAKLSRMDGSADKADI